MKRAIENGNFKETKKEFLLNYIKE